MNATSVTQDAAIEFIHHIGLSQAHVSTVSNAIAQATVWSTIAILVLSLLFPDQTYEPGEAGYMQLKTVNWYFSSAFLLGCYLRKSQVYKSVASCQFDLCPG